MQIIGYNIRKNGYGREDLIANVLRHTMPDIVILAEASDPQTVSRIAQLAGFPHFVARKGYSVAFLSRQSPKSFQWYENPSFRSPILEIVSENGVYIYGVHLYAVLSNRMERRRVQEIKALTALTASRWQTPHLLIGDFNTIAPGDTIDIGSMPRWLRWLIRFNGGDVRRDAIASLLDQGYVDVFRYCHPQDTGYTLPTPSPNSRLDYAFTPRIHLSRIRGCRTLHEPDSVRLASDHYPLLLEWVDQSDP